MKDTTAKKGLLYIDISILSVKMWDTFKTYLVLKHFESHGYLRKKELLTFFKIKQNIKRVNNKEFEGLSTVLS